MALTNKNTTSARTFKHLPEFERGKIAAWLEEGISQAEMARRLGKHKNTISREIKRGTASLINYYRETYEAYFPETGQAVYTDNRSKCRKKLKAFQAERFIGFAEKRILEDKWSPDATVGFAKRHKLFSSEEMVSTKTLYNYIDKGFIKVKNIDLLQKVSRRPKRGSKKEQKRIYGKSITERPPEVEKREVFGHWEIDTVLGKRSNDKALLTIVERKTRKKIILPLVEKSAKEVVKAVGVLKDRFGALFKEVFKTITADNGTEFASLAGSNLDVYFTHPYSAWERGTNERHNGLIRLFIPKGKPIRELSEIKIKRVEEWCNNLPRKILGYRTPEEAFIQEVLDLLKGKQEKRTFLMAHW